MQEIDKIIGLVRILSFLYKKNSSLVLSTIWNLFRDASSAPIKSYISWKKYDHTNMVLAEFASKGVEAYIGSTDIKQEDLPFVKLTVLAQGFDRFLPKHVLAVRS